MVARGKNGKLRDNLESTLGPDRFAAEWSAGERVFLEDHVQELVAEATSD